MLSVTPRVGKEPLVVLALAAHPDDLEIGCGGSLLQLLPGLGERPGACAVHSVVMTGTDERLAEAKAAAQELLGPLLAGELVPLGFRDGYLPGSWPEAKAALSEVTRALAPDWVLVPSRSDAHQDHRLLAELAWQLFRGATIWEYEIPKWEGDLGPQNLFVPLSEDTMSRKIDLLRRRYVSQRDKPWYDEEFFRGLSRLRGVECGERYAEAFTVRKTVVR